MSKAKRGSKLMDKSLAIVEWLSGEWLLHGRSNGGAIVFLRAALVSVLIFAAGLSLKCAVDPDTRLAFSLYALRAEVRDNVGWLGAIFAAAYTGFYARYSSQWSYLAGLYNQIMAAACTLDPSAPKPLDLRKWEVGFIEDCYLMHLDRKEVFAFVIKQLLEEPAVYKVLIETTTPKVAQEILKRAQVVPKQPPDQLAA